MKRHTCILGYYGDTVPMGILPAWDGVLFTKEAAQATIDRLEAERVAHPEMLIKTPFGMCTVVRAYLDDYTLRWELEEKEEETKEWPRNLLTEKSVEQNQRQAPPASVQFFADEKGSQEDGFVSGL